MSKVQKCRECGSENLLWAQSNSNKTGIAEGRLRTHEVTCSFVLGCEDCSETIAVISAEKFISNYDAAQAELAALREELATEKKRYASDVDSADQETSALRECIRDLKSWRECSQSLGAFASIIEQADAVIPAPGPLRKALTAAEQRNADLEKLIAEAHAWVDQNNFGGSDAYDLRDRLAAALNTESGASE